MAALIAGTGDTPPGAPAGKPIAFDGRIGVKRPVRLKDRKGCCHNGSQGTSTDGEGGHLELKGVVSMVLGMIDGGIYVVVNSPGTLSWLAFTLAGIVVICAGYSYIEITQLSHAEGASPTYSEWFVDSHTLAETAGWTLLFGYVGSMAMCAYAFGSYGADITGIEGPFGFPLRVVPLLAIVGAFVELDPVGAEESNWIGVVPVVEPSAGPETERSAESQSGPTRGGS